MKSFGPFEAFLFDQDGTIIDSEQAHWEAWRNVAKKYNFIIPEEMVRKTQGTTDAIVAQELLRYMKTERIINNLKVKEYFNVIVTRDHVKRNKPNPDIYYKAAEVLNTKPEACCVFEDSDTGLMAAKNAHMFCVSIPNEVIKHRDFSKADVKVRSLNDINIKENKIVVNE